MGLYARKSANTVFTLFADPVRLFFIPPKKGEKSNKWKGGPFFFLIFIFTPLGGQQIE
jgi:hypothetical protein